MLPTLHVFAKTAIELRRSINRLENFMKQHPADEEVVNGTIEKTIEELKEARRHIPKTYWDSDLV